MSTNHEPITTEIDGLTYKTKKLPAMKGGMIYFKLIDVFGGGTFRALVSEDVEIKNTQDLQNPAFLMGLLSNISEKMTEAGGMKMIFDLLSQTVCLNGRVGEVVGEIALGDPHRFNSHFSGEYVHLAKVALWVARVNFNEPSRGESLIDIGKELMRAGKAKKKETQESSSQ